MLISRNVFSRLKLLIKAKDILATTCTNTQDQNVNLRFVFHHGGGA
jgi:hypothetical protein